MSLILSFQIYKEPKKPEILVDGWNVYFFDKIEELVSKSERWIRNGATCSSANEKEFNLRNIILKCGGWIKKCNWSSYSFENPSVKL